MKSNSEFMKEVQKAGAFENEPNDRHYTLCPECGCGTDDVTVHTFGMCIDCYNSGSLTFCLGCGDEIEEGGNHCQNCTDWEGLEIDNPMPSHWQERADELGCTVALVKYIDELETRVRFLEDLPTLKDEGLMQEKHGQGQVIYIFSDNGDLLCPQCMDWIDECDLLSEGMCERCKTLFSESIDNPR